MRVPFALIWLVTMVLVAACSGISHSAEVQEAIDSGNLKHLNGDHDGAIADYSRAIELDPDLVLAYRARGWVYLLIGDLDQAIADYDRAVELDPDRAAHYASRGMAYQERGDLDRAIADFDRWVELDTETAPAYLYRGRAYRDKGDIDRATADFREILKITDDPRHRLLARTELNALGVSP